MVATEGDEMEITCQLVTLELVRARYGECNAGRVGKTEGRHDPPPTLGANTKTRRGWGTPAFLKTNIAMALVPASVAASGADLIVECCANKVRAKQVPLPFYKRPKKTIP